jgi:hypothetical protein
MFSMYCLFLSQVEILAETAQPSRYFGMHKGNCDYGRRFNREKTMAEE